MIQSIEPTEMLEYSIHGFSSHSASYHPSHITTSKPTDQSSRWSSGSNNQMQFITIKLASVAIAQTITFGKYHKVHVCNLKEFKVFGGMDPDHMTELLHSGLRNDSEQETFALKHKANGVKMPCQYIKIVPLLAWGANFNFSIWYVELRGIKDPQVVQNAYREFTDYRETEVIRLCLKHFRKRNLLDSFQALQKQTNLTLEHPLLSQLHQNLVINGNFDYAETLMQQALNDNLFDDYISDLSYKPVWNRITNGPNGVGPTMRGGHQMCIDNDTEIIYLFGGWDGTRDLSDFWAYHCKEREWRCISLDTRKQGGPDPRSCHKICFDPNHKVIYTLGKYVDPDSRPNIQLDSDFWKFDLITGRWTKINNNTAQEGGPDLIYDHQMVVDSDRGTLYVFGGRTISPDPAHISYSGLFSWNIATNTWRCIKSDLHQPSSAIQIKSRIGHSMLFNPLTREIYIFAGQRNKDFLADFYIYQIDTDRVIEVSRDYSKNGGPDAGFTQRATIDVELGEFYVLSGLMREKNALSETKNAFWVYNIKKNKWTKVYENENVGTEYWSTMTHQEPRPRFAHQLVYNSKRKSQYLFGGNPGENAHPNLRLDDFWELYLTRPSPTDMLRKAQFQIRKQKFVEYSTVDKAMALQYLQTSISQVVDHSDEVESKEFRELTLHLFSWNPRTNNDLMVEKKNAYPDRSKLYDVLLTYFPENMREPKANLIDLVPMV
ncbi:Muskelin N-terminus-domain-containing protein [Globomyces pollinis-pini]|nr:Muskelin N-terminus-domain-containing protein [Globomyces pollinis-pini]